jgi:Sulfotransferase domain
VFYTYEPLHCLGSFERMESAVHFERSIDLLRPLLRCQFPDYYFNYTIDATFGDPSLFISSNSQALKFCKDEPVYCKRPGLYSDLCGQFPIHLMKLVRMPLNLTRQLIEEFADSDFKIIYLTRDPRGIMASRIDKYFCIHPSCTETSELCKHMREDLKSFQGLRDKYTNVFYKLRFEDVAANVEDETRQSNY